MTEIPQPPEQRAAEFLVKGQNFFDQPPFSKALQDVSAQTGVQRAKLGRVLTSAGRNLSRSVVSDVASEKLNSLQISEMMEGFRGSGYASHNVFARSLHPRGTVSADELKAVQMLGSSLKEHPFWSEYIKIYAKQGYYRADGEPNPQARRTGFDPTYTKWLADTLALQEKQEERSRIVGSGEAFGRKGTNTSSEVPFMEDHRES